MKKKILSFVHRNFSIMSFALLVSSIIILSISACTNTSVHSSDTIQLECWEYKMLNLEIYDNLGDANNNLLNHVGEQGWELVSVTARPGWSSSKYLHYFKRRVESNTEIIRVPSELVGFWVPENGKSRGFVIATWDVNLNLEEQYYFAFQGGCDGYSISVSTNSVTISMGEDIEGTFNYSIKNGIMKISKATGNFKEWNSLSFIYSRSAPNSW